MTAICWYLLGLQRLVIQPIFLYRAETTSADKELVFRLDRTACRCGQIDQVHQPSGQFKDLLMYSMHLQWLAVAIAISITAGCSSKRKSILPPVSLAVMQSPQKLPESLVDDSKHVTPIALAAFDPSNETHAAYGLEQLLELAFDSNPAIKELAATTQVAAGYRTQVGLYANPLVGYQGQQLADAGTDQHTVFIEQQIITGGKLQLNRRVLNEALRAQLQELEAQKLRVATDLKSAYFDCIRMQEQLQSIDQFSTLLKRGVTVAEDRLKAGEASKIELLQTQVQLKQLELQRNQLAVSLQARLREIAAVAGQPNLQLRAVTGQLPETPELDDWSILEEQLVAMSPEVAAAQARISQAVAAISRNELQNLPNLSMQVAAGVDNGTDSGMMNVQLGVPLPVFNKNQGNIAAARAEHCRAVQEARRIDNAIRARLAVALGQHQRSMAAVKMLSDEMLPIAQESMELAESAYRAGELDFIQLLVTRRTYFDTNLALTAARADLAIAQAQIDGFVLSGALDAVIQGSGDDSLRGLTLEQR